MSKGGGKSNSNSPTNTDRRAALQDAIQTGDGSTTGDMHLTSINYAADAEVLQTLASTMPDAVRAMADAGADVINRAGGAVVNLNRDSITANSKSFDSVVDFGAAAIDKIIDASVQTTKTGNALAAQAVQAFTPTENKNAESMKWGLIAAAGVAAVVIMGKNK